MIADVRRAVAVASYVMVTNRVASSVFDFANGGYHPMSVSHTGNFLSVYDYQRSNYLSGYLPNLFDYSTASYVNMMMSGNTINGFDYHTATYFTVTVNAGNVTIFDYQMAQYYMYSVN